MCKAQLQNKRITICSYNAREAVVCCPDGEENRFSGDPDQVPPSSSAPNSLEEDRNARIAVKSKSVGSWWMSLDKVGLTVSSPCRMQRIPEVVVQSDRGQHVDPDADGGQL